MLASLSPIKSMPLKIQNTSFNSYRLKIVQEIVLDDNENPISSKLRINHEINNRIYGKLLDYEILEEVHFFQTHLAVFGKYASFPLQKVVDGDSYYYERLDYGHFPKTEKINHKTIDGEDWLIEDDCSAKIVEFDYSKINKEMEEGDPCEAYQ